MCSGVDRVRQRPATGPRRFTRRPRPRHSRLPRSTRRCSPGCAGAHSAPPAGDGRKPSRAAAAARWSTTSAQPAADCGRRPTGVRRGNRCRIASSSRHPSEPSPSPSRIRTSSTSAWARRSCAATCSRATASTSPPMPGRRGRTSASRRRLTVARIRVHPTNPDIVYVAALGDPYGTESGARRLQDRRRRQDVDEEFCSATTRPARSTCRWTRRTRTCSTPAFGRSSRTPALAVERRARQRPVQVNRRRRALDRDHEEPRPAETNLGQGRRCRCRAPIRTRVYAIIEAAEGGVFLSDDAGATWKMVNEDRRLRQRAFYYTRIYADPQVKDTVYILNTGDLSLDGRRQDRFAASACRTATTTTCGSRRTIRSG